MRKQCMRLIQPWPQPEPKAQAGIQEFPEEKSALK